MGADAPELASGLPAVRRACNYYTSADPHPMLAAAHGTRDAGQSLRTYIGGGFVWSY